MVRVGINGFGRIGRVISRIIQSKEDIEVVIINDINPDINNIAYLFNYDTTYGRNKEAVHVDNDLIVNSELNIKVFCENDLIRVPWKDYNLDFLIDSSGIIENLDKYHYLRESTKNIIITNSPDSKLVNNEIIYGVNHESYNSRKDFIISSSICDATAISPIIKCILEKFNIANGFLTTLHPWLGYQNLLDGPSKSYAVLGEIYDNYALGRSSPMTLIPKNTSAIKATYKVIPEIEGKFIANSYRVPTNIVSSADITLKVKEEINKNTISDLFLNFSKKNPGILDNNFDGLVSTDFIGSDYAATIDHRFLNVTDNYIKLICWYDNEWGYSSKVVDLISHISNG